MSYQIKLKESSVTAIQLSAVTNASFIIRPLSDAQKSEALIFLGTHSVDTLYMTSLILDNGVNSSFNRGIFYGIRNAKGQLEGVALIGHATLVEARTQAALAASARLAKEYRRAHIITGEQEKVETFWHYYSKGGQEPRRLCRELLFEQHCPIESQEPVSDLRRATLNELTPVMLVQSRMAEEENGINPLEKDPEGFCLRVARRIEQGRVWVWIDDGRLIFKVDVMADTPDVNYLEGLYIHPNERRKGYGLRCISQVGRNLLAHTRAISLVVNEQNKGAQIFFFKAGYKLRGCYDTIYLQQESH